MKPRKAFRPSRKSAPLGGSPNLSATHRKSPAEEAARLDRSAVTGALRMRSAAGAPSGLGTRGAGMGHEPRLALAVRSAPDHCQPGWATTGSPARFRRSSRKSPPTGELEKINLHSPLPSSRTRDPGPTDSFRRPCRQSSHSIQIVWFVPSGAILRSSASARRPETARWRHFLRPPFEGCANQTNCFCDCQIKLQLGWNDLFPHAARPRFLSKPVIEGSRPRKAT